MVNNFKIKHITYHILNKKQHENAELLLNRNTLTPSTEHLNFLEKLSKYYTEKAGKGFGKFKEHEESDLYMPKILSNYLSNENFQELSERMMDILLAKIQNQGLATGGKVFICDYLYNDNNYMLIAMLSDRITYSAENWIVSENEALDIEHLKHAGLINLTAWQNKEERYISFLKGPRCISVYFKEFLSCNDNLIPKNETKKLVSLINEFCEDQGFNKDEKTKFIQDAKFYLMETIKNRREFNSEEFSNRVYPGNSHLLQKKLSNIDSGVQDGFTPTSNEVKVLSTVAVKTPNWSLIFDRKIIGIAGGILCKNGKIIIDNPPQELLNEFK